MSQIVKDKGIKKGCFTRENLGFRVYLLRDKSQKFFLLHDADSSDVNNIMCKVIKPAWYKFAPPYRILSFLFCYGPDTLIIRNKK
jgi:hypothetical protein